MHRKTVFGNSYQSIYHLATYTFVQTTDALTQMWLLCRVDLFEYNIQNLIWISIITAICTNMPFPNVEICDKIFLGKECITDLFWEIQLTKYISEIQVLKMITQTLELRCTTDIPYGYIYIYIYIYMKQFHDAADM